MVLHVRFESWYISLPSSAKQQHEMTSSTYFGEREPQWLIFLYLLLEWNAVSACLA